MKVVLDTDIGTDIDDAWALGYALKSPSFQLLGVTVSDADTPARARLAAKLLHRLGRTDVPVAIGRKTAAVPPDRVDYQFTWAEDFEAYKPVATPAVICVFAESRSAAMSAMAGSRHRIAAGSCGVASSLTDTAGEVGCSAGVVAPEATRPASISCGAPARA